MIVYRIADGRYPIYDGTGAMLRGSRWNSPGRLVIYAAESYAGAMLEVLVHANLATVPKHHKAVRISIPPEVRIESAAIADTAWEGEDVTATRAYGDRWLKELRSAVLRVPSVVTRGTEHNVLIHPLHPEASLIEVSEPKPIQWDTRLFTR